MTEMAEALTPRTCSIARTLELVGERWALLALREVFFGVRRFDAIQRNTGAPRDILSVRLRKLVAEGLLERRQYQERRAERKPGRGRRPPPESSRQPDAVEDHRARPGSLPALAHTGPLTLCAVK